MSTIHYDANVRFDEVMPLDVITWLGHDNSIQMAGTVIKNECGIIDVMTVGGPGQLLRTHHSHFTTMYFYPDHYKVALSFWIKKETHHEMPADRPES